MPTLPSWNRLNAPSVRLVLPGLTWVTFSLLARSARNCRACTFLSLLIVHLPLPSIQSPPLFHIQMENSACASSGPSGSAYPIVPLPSAWIFLASATNWSHVVGGAAMPALANESRLRMSGGWLFWIMVVTCWSITFQSTTCRSTLLPVAFSYWEFRSVQNARVWSLLYSATTTLMVRLPPLEPLLAEPAPLPPPQPASPTAAAVRPASDTAMSRRFTVVTVPLLMPPPVRVPRWAPGRGERN